jgi:hypothetical protein
VKVTDSGKHSKCSTELATAVKKFCVSGTTKMLIIVLPYFIEYNAHTSIVRTWISQWFLLKKYLFLFFKNNFTRMNHCKFIYHKCHIKPFLSYLQCTVCREYFSIIFNVKKCALYSIKYSKWIFLLFRPKFKPKQLDRFYIGESSSL